MLLLEPWAVRERGRVLLAWREPLLLLPCSLPAPPHCPHLRLCQSHPWQLLAAAPPPGFQSAMRQVLRSSGIVSLTPLSSGKEGIERKGVASQLPRRRIILNCAPACLGDSLGQCEFREETILRPSRGQTALDLEVNFLGRRKTLSSPVSPEADSSRRIHSRCSGGQVRPHWRRGGRCC